MRQALPFWKAKWVLGKGRSGRLGEASEEESAEGGAGIFLTTPCPLQDALAPGPFASFPNGWTGKQKSPDGVHRVRVDFKVQG